MVRFDNPEIRTNSSIGERTVRIRTTGSTKNGFTVALCVSASGIKLPAFIIFKERSGRIPPRVQITLSVPHNVVVEANQNGWMTAPMLHTWITNVFAPYAVGRGIILLDQYRPHHMADSRTLLSNLGFETIGIPAGIIGT